MPRRKTRAPKARRKTNAVLILSTVDDPLVAGRIAAALVEEGLAACVNVTGPIHSIYRWRGALTTESEHLMLIKTRAALYAALEQRLKELHPYEIPEIIGVELWAGAKTYLDWLTQSTGNSGRTAAAPKQPSATSGRRSAT
jgi:periplasmic divalent cation tolerance protein